MTATTTKTAAPEVKLSAGDIAIRDAQKTCTNAVLLKAIWSTRGNIRVQVKGADAFGGIAVIKSDITNVLKNLPPADQAGFVLLPRADGADLVSVAQEA